MADTVQELMTLKYIDTTWGFRIKSSIPTVPLMTKDYVTKLRELCLRRLRAAWDHLLVLELE